MRNSSFGTGLTMDPVALPGGNLRVVLAALDISPMEFAETEAKMLADRAALQMSGATPCWVCESEPAIIDRDIGDGEIVAMGKDCSDALDEADPLGI